MVRLGKKCPHCGEKNAFSTIESAVWFTKLPLTHRLMCDKCREQLLTFSVCTIPFEERKHTRVKLPRTFLLKIPSQSVQYLRIEDISEGGICFDYNNETCLKNNETLLVDLYCCDDGSTLENIPIEILATYERAPESNHVPMQRLVTGARFQELSQAQKKVLNRCIKYHAVPAG